MRLAKTFTEADADRFLDESFTFIRQFFANSLSELKARNEGVDTTYREIDANRFSAIIYKNGKAIARCGIRLGGLHSAGISYSENDRDNSYSEQLSVGHDDYALYLTSMMSHFSGGERDTKLTAEGAAELLWAKLIQPLQGHDDRY